MLQIVMGKGFNLLFQNMSKKKTPKRNPRHIYSDKNNHQKRVESEKSIRVRVFSLWAGSEKRERSQRSHDVLSKM